MQENVSSPISIIVKVSAGPDVTVGRLTLKGLIAISEAVKRDGLLSRLDLSKADVQVVDVIREAVTAAPALAKTLIAATTSLNEAEAEVLPLDDALAILEAALEINRPERYLPALKKVLGLAISGAMG